MIQPSKTTVIAIAGASASGKSLFAKTIYQELLPELGPDGISILKEDAYYRDQSDLTMDERAQTNYDHPRAFEHELLSEHLTYLIAQKTIDCPVYCYKTHTRTTNTLSIKPTKIILVEGILLLSNPQLRDCFDIKVYMDTPLDICLIRRIKRDTEERERSLESITNQYLTTVRPMYYQFIEPSKAWADLVITRGGKNRMAIEVLKAKIRQLSLKSTQ
ncbi:uridine kinase [Colwellia sp. 4_MG-2023]|uniref:uridine kinase n=1 Tax=unclassified Colwellia TaxID=196834 RepID=UPI0026E3FF53|nr:MULTISPECIES: uridine kinase [unclassified Colwellia]MDO6508003.1 uridine kinase [Colwellia sp. 5_MG-2023]MDO6556816.1 uridine kinase [Colwellia sp. 4_MG-2023]